MTMAGRTFAPVASGTDNTNGEKLRKKGGNKETVFSSVTALVTRACTYGGLYLDE
jgi:hypothetical protein